MPFDFRMKYATSAFRTKGLGVYRLCDIRAADDKKEERVDVPESSGNILARSHKGMG